ncbi:MAG: FliH/SctL family protein [Pseudomonadota bacterium]
MSTEADAQNADEDAATGEDSSGPELLSTRDIRALLKRNKADFFPDTPARGGPTLPPLPAHRFTPLTFETSTPTSKTGAAPPRAPDPEEGAPDFKAKPAAATLDLEAIKAAAREEGRTLALTEIDTATRVAAAEARAAAEAEAEARLEAARDAFTALKESFTLSIHEAETALAARIEEAVLRLASDRAGQAIDALPDAFLVRIAKLCRDLANAASEARIALNPHDLAAIAPHLETAKGLGEAGFEADETLARGDLRLILGDVICVDTLARQAP